MRRILVFLPLALLVSLGRGQTPQASPEALRSGCSADDEQLAALRGNDAVEVRQALAGEDETCYQVILMRDGKAVTGFVLGNSLPAVRAFVKRQARYRDLAFAQEQQRAWQEALARQRAAATAKSAAATKLDPGMPAEFEEFGGKDSKGKPFSLAGLGGRVILVTFWSPKSAGSKGQLLRVLPLYNQYKGDGLRAVGISMDPNPQHIGQALDDITLGWPQVADRSGMAKRYGASAATGTTLILDASHHILAAGLAPAELEKKVRELMGSN